MRAVPPRREDPPKPGPTERRRETQAHQLHALRPHRPQLVPRVRPADARGGAVIGAGSIHEHLDELLMALVEASYEFGADPVVPFCDLATREEVWE